MAISSSYDFNVTRDEIIAGALRVIGVIAPDETPTTAMYTSGSQALNMIVKAWQADGMPVWVMAEYTLPLITNTTSYTINTKMLKVVQAFNRNTSTNIDIPMRIVSQNEYNRLGNKSTNGNPVQIYHQPLLSTSVVKVYPMPSSVEEANNEIHLVYQKQFSDMDSSSDNLEFPQEYFDAVKFALANRLSFEYGMDIQDRKQLLEQAMMLKQDALSFGTEEGSVFFGPDIRRW